MPEERPPRSALVARTFPPVMAVDPARTLELLLLRLSCCTVPEERLLLDTLPEERTLLSERLTVLPEERLVLLEDRVEVPLLEERVELLPVLRLRLSCCTALEDRVLLPSEERLTPLLEDRVAELLEELRVEEEVLWEERVLLPLLPREERLWASISGAVSMAMAITREAANVINLFIASEF